MKTFLRGIDFFRPLFFLRMIFFCCFLIFSIQTFAFSSNSSEFSPDDKTTLYFFWGEGCPHCAAAKPFLARLKSKYPGLHIRSYEIYYHPENLDFLRKMIKSRGREPRGVPTFIIGKNIFEGFNENISKEIEAVVSTGIGNSWAENEALGKGSETKPLSIPLFGEKDPLSLSLPLVTVIIAGLDSFNPCAFFVLFTLLSLMVHAHSRKRMLLIGGVFVFFSGCIYFLFMATWLNLFFIIGHLSVVTYVAGGLALIISLINIKDFFFYKKGISLSISEASKPKLFERMRGLLKTESLLAVLTGTVFLAVTANSYELLCTAGFPMVFTRLLTLNSLTSGEYYIYLTLYNLIYVLPLTTIVVFFVVTLGSRKLTEWQGRVLKLVSGVMMLCLALVLLIDPALLQNAVLSIVLLFVVIFVSTVIVMLTKRFTGT